MYIYICMMCRHLPQLKTEKRIFTQGKKSEDIIFRGLAQS